MHTAGYYRSQAVHARRLLKHLVDERACKALEHLARDFEEIAEDLERGLVDIRHPERLPQRQAH